MTQFSFGWILSLNRETTAAPSVLPETERDMRVWEEDAIRQLQPTDIWCVSART